MASVDFKITVDIPLFDHLEEILNDDATKKEVHELLAQMSDPYVPYRTGALASNIDITAQGVTYNQPYAEKNYLGVGIPHNPQYHPLATALWDEAMMRDRGDEFLLKVQDIVLRRLEEIDERG